MSEDCWSPWPFQPAPASRVSKGLFTSVNYQGYWTMDTDILTCTLIILGDFLLIFFGVIASC